MHFFWLWLHFFSSPQTVKGTKQLKLDPSIYESLQKEKVQVGDVVYIEANSGAVKVRIYFVLLRDYGSWTIRTPPSTPTITTTTITSHFCFC